MKPRLKNPDTYPQEIHTKIIQDVLQRGTTFSYIGLYRTLKEVGRGYIRIGDSKAKLFVAYYVSKNFIQKKDAGLYQVNPI
jgi:hypothetical protein